MECTLPTGSVAPGQRLDFMVATILNKCIGDIGMQCMKCDTISPRVEIAVIGYSGDGVGSALGGSLRGKDLVSITELMENPLRVDERTREAMDDAGNLRTNSVQFPVFIDPKASGGTPMNEAVEYAGQIASEWVQSHRDSHPPVVINITDGISTDSDPRPMAYYLKQLATNDGNLLMFNCHISTAPGNQISYPERKDELPPIDGAEMLLDMSSEILENLRQNADRHGLKIRPHARGYMFLGDIDFFRWGPGDFRFNYFPQGE